MPNPSLVNYCCPIKVRKGTSRGLNHRIETVELSIFDFQAPLEQKTLLLLKNYRIAILPDSPIPTNL